MDEQTKAELRKLARDTAAKARVGQLLKVKEEKRQIADNILQQLKETTVETAENQTEVSEDVAEFAEFAEKHEAAASAAEAPKQVNGIEFAPLPFSTEFVEVKETSISKKKEAAEPPKEYTSRLRDKYKQVKEKRAETQQELNRVTETLRGRCETMDVQLKELIEAIIHDENLLEGYIWKFSEGESISITASTPDEVTDRLKAVVLRDGNFEMKDATPVEEGQEKGTVAVYFSSSSSRKTGSIQIMFDDYNQMFDIIKAWNITCDLRPLQNYKKELALELSTIQQRSKEFPTPEIVLEDEKKRAEEAAKKIEEMKNKKSEASAAVEALKSRSVDETEMAVEAVEASTEN